MVWKRLVWKEIEKALLNADVTLEKLNENYFNQEKRSAVLEAERALVEKSIISKSVEKEKMLDLDRRQLISITDLENQLAKIASEESSLDAHLKELRASAREQEQVEKKLNNAEELIEDLQNVLRNPLTWEVKRQVVELLVWEVKVNTITQDNKKENRIILTFAFGENMLSANRTDRDS